MSDRGALHRVAHGYYVVAPPEHVGSSWLPTLEAVAAGIGVATFGPADAVLIGLSAARLHGALPRAIAVAFLGAPKQHAPVHLVDRRATIRFSRRHIGRLDVESVSTELGRATVTTPEQTVLDLGRGLGRVGAEAEARHAVAQLLPRCDAATLDRLAGEQRMKSTLARIQSWVR